MQIEARAANAVIVADKAQQGLDWVTGKTSDKENLKAKIAERFKNESDQRKAAIMIHNTKDLGDMMGLVTLLTESNKSIDTIEAIFVAVQALRTEVTALGKWWGREKVFSPGAKKNLKQEGKQLQEIIDKLLFDPTYNPDEDDIISYLEGPGGNLNRGGIWGLELFPNGHIKNAADLIETLTNNTALIVKIVKGAEITGYGVSARMSDMYTQEPGPDSQDAAEQMMNMGARADVLMANMKVTPSITLEDRNEAGRILDEEGPAAAWAFLNGEYLQIEKQLEKHGLTLQEALETQSGYEQALFIFRITPENPAINEIGTTHYRISSGLNAMMEGGFEKAVGGDKETNFLSDGDNFVFGDSFSAYRKQIREIMTIFTDASLSNEEQILEAKKIYSTMTYSYYYNGVDNRNMQAHHIAKKNGIDPIQINLPFPTDFMDSDEGLVALYDRLKMYEPKQETLKHMAMNEAEDADEKRQMDVVGLREAAQMSDPAVKEMQEFSDIMLDLQNNPKKIKGIENQAEKKTLEAIAYMQENDAANYDERNNAQMHDYNVQMALFDAATDQFFKGKSEDEIKSTTLYQLWDSMGVGNRNLSDRNRDTATMMASEFAYLEPLWCL